MASPAKDPGLAAAGGGSRRTEEGVGQGRPPSGGLPGRRTEADRKKIDDLIQKAVFENNGSDSLAAGRELVAMGLKAAPRLLNVFYTVKVGEGFDSQEGKMKASVADSLLRKIDGYMERKRRVKRADQGDVRPEVGGVHREDVAGWWDTEAYKKPEKPYDARYDDNPDGPAMEDEAAGMVVGDRR